MSDGTLTVYQRMPDQLEAVKVLGTAIAKSGMFGCGSIEAGMVFATECMFRNMPPLSMAERYHVIFGKLSMKAEAMLAGFEREGGSYKVISRTPELVSIEMTPPNGKPEVLSLSWEDAQKEPFPYEGKEDAIVKVLTKGGKPELKPKYATPRSRMQMLWARLVSDSVRFLCPQVVSGTYTPEEIEDFDENQAAAKSNGNGKANKTSATAAATPPVKQEPQGEVIEVDFVVVKDEPKTDKPSADEFTTPAQRARIDELFDALGMTGDQRTKALAKRNASTLRDLKSTLADELITALESRVKPTLPTLEVTGDPNGATCGLCTEQQEKAIKSAFEEWKQVDREKCDAAIVDFKKKLHEAGYTKIRDLSANDAARLCDGIKTRTLASFITRSLETWKPLANKSDGEQKTAA